MNSKQKLTYYTVLWPCDADRGWTKKNTIAICRRRERPQIDGRIETQRLLKCPWKNNEILSEASQHGLCPRVTRDRTCLSVTFQPGLDLHMHYAHQSK